MAIDPNNPFADLPDNQSDPFADLPDAQQGESGIMPALGAGIDKMQEIGYRAVKGFTDVGVPQEEQTNALGRAIGQGGALSRWADEGIARNIEEQKAYTPSVASYKDIDSIGDAASYVGEMTAQSVPMMATALNPAGLFAMGGGLSNEAYEAQPEDNKQPWRATASGFGQAGLERLGVETAIGRVFGGEGKQFVKRVGQSMLGEGVTETGQEALAQWGEGKSLDELENLDEAFVGGALVGGTIRTGTEAGKAVYDKYRGERPELSDIEETDLTQSATSNDSVIPDPFADIGPAQDQAVTGNEVEIIPGETAGDTQPNWQFGQNDMPYRGQVTPYIYDGEYEQYREAPNSVPVGAALEAPVIDGEFERPRGLPNRANTIIGEDGRPMQQAQEFADSVGQASNRALPFDDVIYAPGMQPEQVQNENAAGDAYWQQQQARSGNEVNRRQLEREAQNYQGAPALPQKNIIYGEDGRNVQIKRNGQPFGGRRAAQLTKEFRQAKEQGLNPQVIKVNGGYGWITDGEQQVSAPENKAEQAQPTITTKPAQKREAPKKSTRTKVYTPNGRELEVEYAIVDADQLVTSNTDDGRVNPDYPQTLQPRDRTRASSEIQINSIANNLNPALLGESATTGDGAPIISDSGIVESGNGRSLALKRAYQNGKADKYRSALIEQGYDVSGFEKPVLARIRRTQMNDQDLVDYTKESNERSTLSLSASETAKADAKAISNIIADFKGGDISAASNRDFVRKFMQGAVSQSEQASMIDKQGMLSQDGRRRVEAAMIANAYENAELVNDLFESSDNDIKSIGGALLDASGDWAKMRAAKKAGATQDDVDITTNVIDAVNLVRRSRAEGKKLSEMVSQTDLFAGDIDPTTKVVLGIFYGGENFTKPRSRQRVKEALSRYAELASNTKGGDDLFGGELETVKPEQLLGKANEANEQTDQQAEAQTSLLDQDPQPTGQSSAGDRGEGQRPAVGGNGQTGAEGQVTANKEPPESGFLTPKETQSDNDLTIEQVMDLSPALAGAGGNASSGFGIGSLVAKQAREVAEKIQFDMREGLTYKEALEKARKSDDFGTEQFEKAARQAYGNGNSTPAKGKVEPENSVNGEELMDMFLNAKPSNEVEQDSNTTSEVDETLKSKLLDTAKRYQNYANTKAGKEYKPNEARVDVGNEGDTKSIGAINEAKRRGEVRRLRGKAETYKTLAKNLKPGETQEDLIKRIRESNGDARADDILSDLDNLKYSVSGKPFQTEKSARASKAFKETNNAEVVQVGGGFAVKPIIEGSQETTKETAAPKQEDNKPVHEQREAFWDRYSKADESLTVEDAKAVMNAIIENEAEVKEFIGSHTVAQIKDKFYRGWHDSGMKKDELVDSSYEQMVTEFGFIASDSGTLSIAGIGKQARLNSIKQKFEGLSDEKFRDNMKKRKAETDSAISERKKRIEGMSNPQTLEDFRNAVRNGLSNDFTPEQWAQYDRLHADERIAEQAQRETKQISAVDGEVNYELHETTHSKKGHDLFIVSLADRVDRDLYTELNTKAKQLGGYYSAYNKQGAIPGFQFRTEDARNEFLKVLEGESVEKTKVAKDKTASLEELADRIEERANDSLNTERKTNTAKRSREAGYAIANAEGELAKAAELKAIAKAIKDGTAKYITKLSNGTERDLLTSLWNGLRHNADKDLVETRYEGGMAGGLKWKEGVTSEQKVRFAEYPLTRMYPDMVKRVASKMAETKGYTMAGKKLLADAESEMRNQKDSRKRMYIANHKHFSKFREFIKANAENAYYEDVAKDFNRLQRMGITSTPMLRAALLEYDAITRGAQPVNTNNKVKKQIELSKFQGKYKENDFFNSTPIVAKRVIELAEIEEGMSVFEPSAGVGSLADAAAEIVGKSNVNTNELAHGLREYLTEQGYRPTSSDFLTMNPRTSFTFGDVFETKDGVRGIMRGSSRDRVRLVDEEGNSVGPTRYYTRSELTGVEKRGVNSGYDRIIMNPPFSKGQEARHVAHAYRFLKPGGRLVAVTSSMAGERSNKVDKQFREWLDAIGADETPLPEGAFKEAINSTNVNTKTIVIDKPKNADADIEPPLFSLNAGTITGNTNTRTVSRSNANEIVSRFVKGLTTAGKNYVSVVSSYDDLPTEIKDAAKAQGVEYQVKGVFHKGKVHVVLDQHTSALDMETTLFHEAYGHLGIKNLFGDDITKKLNSLFIANGGLKGLRETAKRHSINLEKYIKGLDKTNMPQEMKNRVLMDELLAHMQQSNKPSVKRLAREIVGMIREGLRKLVLPGLSKVTDSDLFYVLKQARAAAKNGPSQSPAETLFRTTDDAAPFTMPEETWTDNALRFIQDKFNRVKRAQDTIRKAGITTSDKADVYGVESLYYGKVEEDFRQLAEKYLEPMAEKMAKHNIKQEELDLFLYALHAPERNAHIHSMDEEMTAGSGMTDDEARRILDAVNRDPRRRIYNELQQSVREMIDERTQQMFEQGLIDEETFSGFQDNYQYYVPLKGQAKDEGGKPKGTGMGFNIKGKESIAALGRKSRAESPLLHAYLDTQRAITRGHKNEVGNALLNLIEEAPNPELWSAYTTEGPLERKKGPDGKVKMVPMSKEKMSALSSNPQSEWFATKRGGMEYYIKIDDPVLAMQMKNVGVDNGNRITQALGTVNRFLSMMATSANPEFLITNVTRDVQTALYNLAAESDVDDGKLKGVDVKALTKNVLRDMPKALAGIRRALRENRTDTEWSQTFDDFRKAGAKTGYFDMKDIETQSKDLQQMMKLQSKPGLIKHAKAALKFIEDYNSAVENTIRVSVYKNAIDAGISKHQAAVVAKNLTVNFNRKGQAGTWLNSLYLFANAGIQGTANFARAIGTFKTVDGERKLNLAQKAGIAMAGIGFSMALMNRFIAGEDDDGESYWDKVPEHVKERNFVLMLPGSNEYVTFPMPYGYNIFANFGTAAESIISGGEISENAGFLTKAAMGSFLPIGLSEGGDALETSVKTIMPQIGKPFIDLATNTNFFGSSIYSEANENYGSKKSDAGSGFKSTNEFYKQVAMGLNKATGGSEYQSGLIDVHPETVRYMLEYIGSGASRFVLNTSETIARGAQGEFEPARTPFVRRFYGETTDHGDSNTFYERLDEVETLQAELESLKGKDRLNFRKENKDMLRLVDDAKRTQKQLKQLRKRLDRFKEKDNKEMVEKVEAQIETTIDRFNLKYNETNN